MSLASNISDVVTQIGAKIKDLTGRVSTLESATWVQLTQAQYDALATKDPDTLYVIVG